MRIALVALAGLAAGCTVTGRGRPTIPQQTAVITGTVGPGVQALQVDVDYLPPHERTPRQLCGTLRVATTPSVILDVRQVSRFVRVAVEGSRGFALQADRGPLRCAVMDDRGQVPEVHAHLGVGRHAIFIQGAEGRVEPVLVRWAPVFAPTEAQLAAWIAADLGGLPEPLPSRPVYTAPMGKPVVIAMRGGFCYRMFLIHRPATPLDDDTRAVSFERTNVDTVADVPVIAQGDEDAAVGWMAARDRYCADADTRFGIVSRYPGRRAPNRGDRLEVRAFAWTKSTP